MYLEGIAVEKDPVEGFKWSKLAAEKGDMEAQHNLGLSYYKGLGVQRDEKEAIKWLKKSAEQDYVKAYFKLGYIYADDIDYCQHGTNEEDATEAVKWFKKAAEKGMGEAYSYLIKLYGTRRYATWNPMEACRWAKKAGASYEKAIRKLIDNLVTDNNLQDLIWLKRIADEENDPYACKCLGDMYFYGRVTEKDYKAAYRYYKKAAQGGLKGYDFESILRKVDEAITLEMTYQEALGLLETSSFMKGIETLDLLAQDKNHADAQIAIGKLYMQGYRLPKDINAALYYFKKAKKNGHPEADTYIEKAESMIKK